MIPIVYASGGGEAEFAKVFDRIKTAKAEMVVFGTETSLSATAQQILVAKMAIDARVPTISQTGAFAEVGGLLGYGGNYPYMARRCADYVAMLLKGSKPSDLPVLQPTVFDFVVNLKTAMALGITIPQSVLLQATETIQ
jgi:putative ABC transport system substrate-binding protein